MAPSESVKVVVELVDEYSDELKELETKLDLIDGKSLEISVDIDDHGQIEKIEKELERLEQQINVALNVRTDIDDALAQKELLEKDMHSTLHVQTDHDRELISENSLAGPPLTWETSGEVFKSIKSVPEPDFDLGSSFTAGTDEGESISVKSPLSTDNLLGDELEVRLEDKEFEIEAGFRDSLNNVMASEGVASITETVDTRTRGPEFEQAISGLVDDHLVETINKQETGEFIFPDEGFTLPDFSDQGEIERPISFNPDEWFDFERDPKLSKSDQAVKDLVDGHLVETINKQDTGEFIMPGSGGSAFPDDFSRRERRDRGRDRDRINKAGFASQAFKAVRSGASTLTGILEFAGDGIGEMIAEGFETAEGSLSGFLQKLKKFRPTMQMWWNLIALATPMLIALGGAALGAAAALAALAVAGAAIVGLGLLGYGSGLGDSMKKAQQRLKRFAKRLYGIFRPVMAVFKPIVDRLFLTAVKYAERLVSPLMKLTSFGGFFEGALKGGILWLREMIIAINDLDDKLIVLGSRIGKLVGAGLIKLFRWAVNELYANQDAFLNLAKIIVEVIVVIYNLSKAVSFVIATFEPLFRLIAWMSGLLGNEFVIMALQAVGALIAMRGAAMALNWAMGLTSATILGAMASAVTWLLGGVTALTGALYSLAIGATSAFTGIITGLYGLISTALTAIGVVGTLNMLLASLLTLAGIGIPLVLAGIAAGGAMKNMSNAGGAPGNSGSDDDGFDGGGNSGGFGGGGAAGAAATTGGGNTMIVNIDGDVNKKEYEKMKDQFPHLYGNESEIEERSTPTTNESGT
ncbi:hypothetical protein ACFQL7_20840 [Halocatena marina]|uniref:Uncharacterized protein n=1 Tax=Halocatena marina TaxID=2934937 RepID=A0ABD5YR02_9EURY|nr:hypothetical protein [Halocatena marina]